jgi:diguanylate cyclase (GGDEF)-like protein/PAS domain S-box-containing protein
MTSNLLPFGHSFRGDASFSSWLDQNPDALLMTDAAGVIEYVNPAFESLTGYPRAEAVGRKPSILKSGAHDDEFYRGLWRSILAGHPFRGVFVDRRKSGALVHAENLIWPVLSGHGRITNFVCQTRDVTERVREAEKLAHAATHDPLTDLPNRTLFLDRLELALRHAARREEVLAVAIFDIDRFRDTNNRYGHLAGDAVLQAVARRSASCVREADTVARIGGDELALILPNASERAGTVAVFEKVRAANAVPVRYEDRLIRVSVSIGASIYPRDATDAEGLRKHADGAMYAAKRAGGNCVRFYRDRVRDGADMGSSKTSIRLR